MKKKLLAQGNGDMEETAVSAKEEKPFFRHLALYSFCAVIALLIPRATVYGGLAPFGVAVAGCVEGPLSLIVYIATTIGYLSASDIVMPLRYIAALISIVGFRWAFSGAVKVTGHQAFSPVLTAGSVMLTGLAVGSIGGFHFDVIVSYLCEAILAGGAAYFIQNTIAVFEREGAPGELSLVQQSSLMISLSLIMMAMNTVVIYDISVGRIVAMVVILMAAKTGQQQGGMLTGVVFGSATVLSSPEYAYLGVTFSFGGMIAGLFARFGKIPSALVFMLVTVMMSLHTGNYSTVIIAAYEVAAASLLFFVMPPFIERAANAVFSRAKNENMAVGLQRAVDMRLVYAADTMKDVAQTVETVSSRLIAKNAPSAKDVFAPALKTVCCECKRRDVCWKAERARTKRAFANVENVLKSNGKIDKEVWSSMTSGECIRIDDMAQAFNKGYGGYLAKEQTLSRLSDVRGIVTDQFEGVSNLLLDLSEDLKKISHIDEAATERVIQVCKRYRLPLVEAVCLVGKRNRITVEILIEGKNVPDENSSLYRELAIACGCDLETPTLAESGFMTKLRFTQKPKFSVSLAVSQKRCATETLCGDAYEHFFDQDGRFCVVLSDGMGTGGRAAVDGAMTAALTGRMLRAGFRYESVVRVINSALIVKSGEESLSTIDCIQLDLFTGQVSGLKAGAAPSVFYSKGAVTTVLISSLPVGILREIRCEEYEEYVRAGDLIVMISDGVADEDMRWLEELISEWASRDVTEKMIADEIVRQASEQKTTERSDDMTALVLRVC